MSPTKFGLSSFVIETPFQRRSLDRLPVFKSMGYNLVEICVEDPATLDPGHLRDRLEALDMEVSVAGLFTAERDFSSADPAVRAAASRYLLECGELASAIGATVVSGPMYAAIGPGWRHDAADRSAARARAAAELARVARQTAGNGVRLAIEPLNRFESDLVNTVDDALAFLEQIDEPGVGLTLDTFHMNIEESDLPAAVRRAGSRLWSFQASENDRGTPGTGHTDWEGLAGALGDLDYDGPIIVESFDPAAPGIAEAVSLWRPVASSMEALARDAIGFLAPLLGDGRDD